MATMPGDEQAKAVAEAAKASGQALAILQAAGGYIADILGTLPQDVVALLGGNWLRVKRAEQLAIILEKSRERLRARGIEPEPASLSLALPLMEAAADEGREELQDIWARLLAAAADPNRNKHFRLEFIEVAKKMAPADAALLKYAYDRVEAIHSADDFTTAAQKLAISRDQLDVSTAHLQKLDLLSPKHSGAIVMAPLGREFIRAIED